MSPALIISGRVPQEMTRLAKEYYAFYGGTHVRVIRYWYRLYDNQKTPQWLLVRLTGHTGHERSTVCMVCSDGNGGYYLSEFLSNLREKEEKMLSEWRRITEEREQEE